MTYQFNAKHPLLILAPEDHLYVQLSEYFETVDYFTDTEDLIEFFHQYREPNHLNVLIDLRLGQSEMMDVLKEMYCISLISNYIVLDESEEIETAINAYRNGATLYLKKPRSIDRFKHVFELSEIKKINQKQFDDTFYMDNLFQNIKMDELFFLRTETDDEIILEPEELTLKIETRIKKPISQLPKPKLLIIEDEHINMQILKLQLRPYFDLVCASSGKESLELLALHPDIALVILDVYLPDTLGTKLYLDIRKTHPTAKVIVFTAYEENEVARELIHSGAYDYINKPYQEKELIEKCFAAWRSLRWPFFEFKIQFETLSDMQKIALFKCHCADLEKLNKHLYHSDIYALFPQLIAYHSFA